MKAIYYFFQTELEKLSNIQNHIDCRGPPEKLLRDLRSSNEIKKLIKIFSSNTRNHLKIIRAYSIANLLLIYGKDHFHLVQQHLKLTLSKDQWINSKFIVPYHHFLMKCCNSNEHYKQCNDLLIKKGRTMEILFYSINMLHLLFKVVEKMPLLGRYYKPTHSELICSAVQIIAAQAQRFYAAFKHSLTQILYRRELYIKNPQDEEIIREILTDELININEEMKKLFLDKYFYPLGKGIGIKLFRPQEQTSQCQKAINSIVSNHENTQREKKHNQLQKTLFPGSGLVNWNFYEETMMSGTLLNGTSKITQSQYKDLNDLAIEEYQQAQPSQTVCSEVDRVGRGCKVEGKYDQMNKINQLDGSNYAE